MATEGASRDPSLDEKSAVLATTTDVSPPHEILPTTICVFCGSSPGNSPAYIAAAISLAEVFHKNNIKLVYGGGTVGLMGQVAKSLVALSGPQSVHGIIPLPLVRYERGSTSGNPIGNGTKTPKGPPEEEIYGRTTIVKDMHSRKLLMAKEVLAGGPGSGFIALPGGYGTVEELMEVVTWNQLGIHSCGIVVLNVEGYWNGLLEWIKGSVDAGFVQKGNAGIIVAAKTGVEAVKALRDYQLCEGRFKLEWGNE